MRHGTWSLGCSVETRSNTFLYLRNICEVFVEWILHAYVNGARCVRLVIVLLVIGVVSTSTLRVKCYYEP